MYGIRNIRWFYAGLCLFFLGSILFYNFYYYNNYIDSDFVGELNYAQLIWQQKTLFPAHWYFSSEIRALSPVLLSSVIYGLFGGFVTSYLVATAIFIIAACFAYLYLLRVSGIGQEAAFLGLMVFLVGFGSSFLKVSFVLGYYIANILVIFLSMSYVLHLNINLRTRKNCWIHIVLGLIALFCGCVSTRMTLLCFMPMLIISGIFVYFYKIDRSCLLKSALLMAVNMVGLLINRLIFLDNSYVSMDVLSLKLLTAREVVDSLLNVIPALINLLGYQDGVALFSLAGINSLGKIVFAVVLCYIIRFIFKKRIGWQIKFVVATWCLSLGFTLLIAIVTLQYDYLTITRYFFIAALLAAFVIPAMYQWIKISAVKYIGIYAIICLVFVAINFTNLLKQSSDFCINEDLQPAAAWIINNNYDFLYASFWHGQAIRGLADGRINVVNLNFSSDQKEKPYYWLLNEQVMAEESLLKEVLFVLSVSEEKMLLSNKNSALNTRVNEKIYEDTHYAIYKFNRTPINVFYVPDIGRAYAIKPVGCEMDVLNNAMVNIADNSVCSIGTAGFFLAGPYKYIRNGCYDISFALEVVEASQNDGAVGFCDIVQDNGKRVVAKQEIIHSTKQLVFHDVTFDKKQNVEFRAFANAGSKIKVKDIVIRRLS